MNINGKGPTLTWIFIGLAIALTIITLSMTSYGTFLQENNGSISDSYSSTYNNISESSTSLMGYSNDLTDQSLIEKVWPGFEGITNVFITGLVAISTFFGMITLTTELFGYVKTVIPGLDAIVGLLIVIISIYIAMSLIKARRGTAEIS